MATRKAQHPVQVYLDDETRQRLEELRVITTGGAVTGVRTTSQVIRDLINRSYAGRRRRETIA